MTTSNDDMTLVVGGYGKTGRRVAERLQAMGRPVRAVSRSAETRFDWQDRSTWAAALEGASQAYVTFQPDLAVPGAPETVSAFCTQAMASGCERLVLLSGRGEPEALNAEDALKASGADWTILRCSWFNQNFSESFLVGSLLAGEVALPAADIAEPFIDAEDIADVAVAALTQAGHSRQTYELTGPQAISFPAAVAAIARATGRDIRYTSISPEAFKAGLEQAQLDAPTIELILYLFRVVLDGRNAKPTDGVQRALGRAPREFAGYVDRTAATGVWQA